MSIYNVAPSHRPEALRAEFINRTTRLQIRAFTLALAVLPVCFSGTALALAPIDLNLITDAALKACVTTQVNARGWQNDEEVTSVICPGMGISSTAGLAQFTRLLSLELGNNTLASIDLTPFPDLEHLNLTQNRVTTIDVRPLVKLRSLLLHANQLTSVDVTSNAQLESLSVSSNALTSLNVANNTKLTFLHAAQNQLTELDVSNNTALTSLNVSSNQLSSVDVSKNTALQSLEIGNNPLTASAMSHLVSINGVAGLVVTLNGSQIKSVVFPGVVTGKLSRTSFAGNSGDMYLFTVAADGTYNFRFDELANTGVRNLSVSLKDEAGATLFAFVFDLPGPYTLQAPLLAGRSYGFEIRTFEFGTLDYTLAVTQAQLHTITGRIIDAEGDPVRGIDVVAFVDQTLLGVATTNRNGVYTITAYGTQLANITVSDDFDRFPSYHYAGSSAGMPVGQYDNSRAGYINATDLDFSTGDLRNINLQIAGSGIEGTLDLNQVTLAQSEFLALDLRSSDSQEFADVDLSGQLSGKLEYQRASLVPNSRYEVRARVFTPGFFTPTAGFNPESYRKVFPTFLMTDAEGQIAEFDFTLPDGSFQFDPSLSSSYGFASSTASLREDGSFASSTLVSADRSVPDSLGVDSSSDAEDYYVFAVRTAGRYDFAVDVANASAVFRLELFDQAQTPLFSVTDTLGPGASPDLSLTLSPGLHYLKISAVSGSSAYTLHLEPGIRDITLNPGFYSDDKQNNSVDQAVNPADLYRFRAQSSGLHHVGIIVDSTTAQLRVVLRDANMAVINAGNDLNMISQTLTAGVDYLVEVRADSGAAEYRLGIEPDSVRQAGAYLPRRGIALPR
jgi:hypothetical protein